MFGANARIIEPGRNRMAFDNLAVIILQKISAVAMQNARQPAGERGRMIGCVEPQPTGFNADNANVIIVQKRMKKTHRI